MTEWGKDRVAEVTQALNDLADRLVTEIGPTPLARNAAVRMIEAAQMLEDLWHEIEEAAPPAPHVGPAPRQENP